MSHEKKKVLIVSATFKWGFCYWQLNMVSADATIIKSDLLPGIKVKMFQAVLSRSGCAANNPLTWDGDMRFLRLDPRYSVIILLTSAPTCLQEPVLEG